MRLTWQMAGWLHFIIVFAEIPCSTPRLDGSMFSRLPYQASRPAAIMVSGLSQYLSVFPAVAGQPVVLEAVRPGGGKPDHRPEMIPLTTGEAAALRANRQRSSVSWLGHASSFIQLAGLQYPARPGVVATGVTFRHLGPKRQVPMPLDLPDLPRIDLVLLTHLHYDHLDFPPCSGWRRSGRGAGGVVPLGVARALRARAFPPQHH
jgi:hypothetical protein